MSTDAHRPSAVEKWHFGSVNVIEPDPRPAAASVKDALVRDVERPLIESSTEVIAALLTQGLLLGTRNTKPMWL